jgi:membrane protein DedA with SNARE-associated domain
LVLERFLDWLAALPTAPTYLVLAALSAIENVFPPAPADVAVALGAFLAQRGELSAWLLGLVCWGANTASAAGMYYLGRARGESLLRSPWLSRILPESALGAIRTAYEKHGVWGIFLSRFLPGFRAAVPPFAGMSGLSPAKALIPAAAASAIWYAAIIFVGSQLGLHFDKVQKLLGEANRVLFVLAIVAAGMLWWWLRQKRSASS